MRGVAIAVAVVCTSCPSSATDLRFDVGAGHIIGEESTHSYGFRGSLGIDFGILEPAFIAHWSPGPDPGFVAHVGQQGGQLLRGFAALLRLHTSPPHQFGVGVGFGSGRMEIVQQAGADAMGYRGTAGPYTVLEAAYRYSAGPVTSVGVAFTTHFFTHVEAICDFGRGGGPFPYGVMSIFSLMADVGLHVPIF